MASMKNFSLKKSFLIFADACKVYKKKGHLLDEPQRKEMEFKLSKLNDALNDKDKKGATTCAKGVELFLKNNFPAKGITKLFYNIAMLGVALFFAIIIRQTCFEFYEIPTGSMRPTFRECDRLVVSKTQFGINIPLTPKHISFSPEEVKRMGTIVFTAEGLDCPGIYTKYFYVFPGVKKFVKRMIGLPEDTLYFYGGKIYGVNKAGEDISHELQQSSLSHIEHIPYIFIDGKLKDRDSHRIESEATSVTIEQNHLPVAKLLKKGRSISGEVLQDGVKDVHELWGMGNYGMSRIVPKEKILLTEENRELVLNNMNVNHFLEITHHSSIHSAKTIFDYTGLRRPTLGKSVSYIPLNTDAIKRIWDNMYTARFNTKKGYLESFGKKYNNSYLLRDRPKIKGRFEDATYEFFAGTAYKVKWQNDPFSIIPSLAIPEKLNSDHVFGNFKESTCVTLYNSGIEQSNYIATNTHTGIAPARYAYFRDGSLYLMGAKIFEENDEALQNFIQREKTLQAKTASYTPFLDEGAPYLADGSLDIEKIKARGLFIPPKSYYTLGDNHAQSGDSREFGFVPEDNLRGVATYMLWAPGGRFGAPLQPAYAWFTTHKVIVWSLVIFGVIIYYALERRKYAHLKRNKKERFLELLGNMLP